MMGFKTGQKVKKMFMIPVMSGIMLLSACSQPEEIPELVAPVINNESYRPVERGNVATRTIEIANVMPEEYCAFYSEAASVEEICVDIGQYVEEGTVLAKMNTEELSERLNEYQSGVANINKIAEYQKLIVEQQIIEQQYLLADATSIGDTDEIARINTQIAILQENAGFDELMRKHQLTTLNESISKLSKIINESSLVAPHSGYVTFVKDLGESTEAGAYENIVIISDYDELHLELGIDIKDTDYTSRIKKDDTEIYILQSGKKMLLSTIRYSNEELVAMERSGKYCKVRFDLDEGNSNLKPGDKIPVYFTNKSRENVLRIGQDSIYTDGRQSFVYVKTDTGKERKDVTLGSQNDVYAEVTEGLAEGEWVYYASGSFMPEQYEEYVVCAKDYSPVGTGLGIKPQKVFTKLYTYHYYDNATVGEVYVGKNDNVVKGDLLCTLYSKEGNAKRVEMEAAIAATKEQQKKTIENYDVGIRELEQYIIWATEIRDAQTANAQSEATETDAGEEVQQSPTAVEQLNCQKLVLEYEKQIAMINDAANLKSLETEYNKLVKNKNSDGSINIYAGGDGVVGQIYAYGEKEISEDFNTLLQVYDSGSEKLAINTAGDFIGVGNTVILTTEDGKVYEQQVLGNSGEPGKCYLVHKDGKSYVTTSVATNKAYISVDGLPDDINLSTTNVTYSSARLSGAIVLPVSLVHMETKIYNPNIIYYYVFKLVDGRIVKQYIQIQDDLNTKTEICVLDGLEDGDVLAVEKVVEK